MAKVSIKSLFQIWTLRWRGSNPGLSGEGVENHVAMSGCTNWPPKWSTNMVIDYCTTNIQSCMIHFCVRSNTLIKMMYHSLLYNKRAMIYINICTLILEVFWLSFSCTHTELSYKNEQRSGFFCTKTDNCILCMDGYSVSVQEIVNKAENTIKPQNLTLVCLNLVFSFIWHFQFYLLETRLAGNLVHKDQS